MERAKSLTADELSVEWEDARKRHLWAAGATSRSLAERSRRLARRLLWAAGLRDLTDVPPGQGYTGHAFNDYNHCDATCMLGDVAHNLNDGQDRVAGIAVNNRLGPGIERASLPELGVGGSWSTCTNGCNREPPRDVAHVQFRSRVAFKARAPRRFPISASHSSSRRSRQIHRRSSCGARPPSQALCSSTTPAGSSARALRAAPFPRCARDRRTLTSCGAQSMSARRSGWARGQRGQRGRPSSRGREQRGEANPVTETYRTLKVHWLVRRNRVAVRHNGMRGGDIPHMIYNDLSSIGFLIRDSVCPLPSRP